MSNASPRLSVAIARESPLAASNRNRVEPPDERPEPEGPEELFLGEEVHLPREGGADERRVPERDVVRRDDQAAVSGDALATANLPPRQGGEAATGQKPRDTIIRAHDFS